MCRWKVKIALACLVAIVVFSIVLPSNLFAPQSGATQMPIGVNRFRVEIDGITTSSFESIEGLKSTISVIDYRDGTSTTALKIPGIPDYSNIILRFSVSNRRELWDWYRNALRGNVERRTMAITVVSVQGLDVVRYHIAEAWPCAWRGPVFNASSNEPALEEIELVIGSIDSENLNL